MAENRQSVDAVLRRAEAHARQGELGKAAQLCKAILAQFPTHARASAMLAAVRAARAGRQAAGNAKAGGQGVAQGGASGNPQAELNDLIALHQQGRSGEVQKRAAALAAKFPRNPIIPNLLGASFAATGHSDDAMASFRRALSIDPKFFPAHTNLGVELARAGRVEEAAAEHSAALRIKPDYVEAHHNLGNCLRRLGRLADAADCFRRVLELQPSLVEAHRSLGAVLSDLGRSAEAVEHLASAVEMTPDDAELRNNLGVALNAAGRHDEAIACYRDVLRQKPDLGEAFTNLCELYEKANDVDELRSAVAQRQSGSDSADAYLAYWQAVLAYRDGNFPEARDHLESIASGQLAPKVRLQRSELLGNVYDRLGDYDRAFSRFTEANGLAAEWQSAHRHDRAGYMDALSMLNESWSGAPLAPWAGATSDRDPVPLAFLVGFPRSGTTLLDTMLGGHSKIAVLEELPTVDRLRAALGRLPTFEALNALSEAEVLQMRSSYLEEAAQHGGEVGAGKLVVDKLPLNLVNAGLIHRVFPEAKFILALRHPCDCVLSCYIQRFRLNDAMANFLDLGNAAGLYDQAMSLWRVFEQKLGLVSATVRYENLVADPRPEIEPLLGFLGLDWQDSVLEHRSTALSRGRIHTPSYNQVTEELYAHASGRWENYRAQMAPVLPVLGPWASELGYSV